MGKITFFLKKYVHFLRFYPCKPGVKILLILKRFYCKPTEKVYNGILKRGGAPLSRRRGGRAGAVYFWARM